MSIRCLRVVCHFMDHQFHWNLLRSCSRDRAFVEEVNRWLVHRLIALTQLAGTLGAWMAYLHTWGTWLQLWHSHVMLLFLRLHLRIASQFLRYLVEEFSQHRIKNIYHEFQHQVLQCVQHAAASIDCTKVGFLFKFPTGGQFYLRNHTKKLYKTVVWIMAQLRGGFSNWKPRESLADFGWEHAAQAAKQRSAR